MRAEEFKAMTENLLTGGGQLGAVLRSHDWSQTPLGAIRTWSKDLKTAVQILLTELDRAKPTQKDALNSDPPQNTTEAALRESEARYRILFEAIDEGFCVCELIWDEMGNPQDHRILEINSAFERLTGLNHVVGKVGSELIPTLEPFWLETYARVVRTGESARFESHIQGLDGWFDVYVDVIDAPESDQFAVVFQNITERKRTEEILQRTASLNAFRAALADALRPLTDPSEIQATASQVLGESLGASRVIYIEVLPGDQEVIVHENYTNSVTELSGLYRLEDFGRNLTADHRSGRTAIVPNVATYPKYTPDETARYHSIQIAAHVDVPLIKNQQFVALLAVHQASPRQWTEDEVKQVEETAEQTWAAVERSRAEAALRQSEERTRNILESIQEAFFALDENWQFTYMNPSAEALLDRAPGDLVGKNIWEEYPGLAANELAQIYRNAMHDRLAGSLTAFYPDHDRWYDVRAYPAPNGIAVYFRNVTDQIQADKALRQSEARFRRIFECNMVPIAVWTTAGGITQANDALLDMIGYTRSELETGQINWQALTPPEYRSLDEIALNEIATKGVSVPYEKVYVCKDGRRIPILIGAASFLDDATSGIFFAIDLTDRKRREAIIATDLENTRLLRDLSARLISEDEIQVLYDEITATAIALTKADAGTVQILDKATQDLLLLASQGFSSTMTDHFYRVNASSNTSCGIALNRGTRTFIDFDVPECDDPDGSLQMHVNAGYLSAQSTPLISRSGKAIGMVSTHWCRQHRPSDQELRFLDLLARQAADLIERRQTEAALRDSEELKQSILDSSKDCIKVLALNGEIVYVNTGGLRLLEINDPTLMLNARWLDFWQGEDRENAKTAIAVAEAGNTGQFQGYRPTHQGTPKWWDILITPVRDSAGQVTQLLVVSRDITKQKQAETERERLLAQEQAAREQAETANRLKDEFLAVLSHELRSPLNPILGWTRLLQTGKLGEARRVEALKTIERNAKLQSQLIEDLLDISRIMQGKLSLNVMPADLGTVISAALETVHLAAEAKSLQIQTTLLPLVGNVMGDTGRLQQVIWNLLSNAVKFTAQGGQITVTLSQAGDHAQIQVADTGKGISPEFLPYVFEHFRQEDGATTRKFGGLGLGLAIARQIVELHGGTITVESEGDGQGATFTVQLPLTSRLNNLPSSEVFSASTSDMKGIHILVVDDEPDSREFVAFVLEQSGAIVTSAASGIEALQVIERFTPNLIVSDIGMPEMNGYMLLQHIRSLDWRSDSIQQLRQIPAIALTAYAGEFDRKQALSAGFQQHLSKPVEPEKLLNAICVLCSRVSDPNTA